MRRLLFQLTVILFALGLVGGAPLAAPGSRSKPAAAKKAKAAVNRHALPTTRKNSQRKLDNKLPKPLSRRPASTTKTARRARQALKAQRKPPELTFRAGGTSRKVSLVIFDLDGTLADTRKDIATNFDAGFRAIGMKLSRHKLLAMVDGAPLEHTFRMIFPNGSAEQLDGFLTGFLASQKKRGPNAETYPGVRRVLNQLRNRGVKLGVATARPTPNAVRMLESLDLLGHFDVVVGIDQSGFPHKPAPDALLHIAKETGVAPRNAIFVGDTKTDIGAANNARMGSVAVSYGMGSKKDLAAQKPTMMANDIRRLLPALGLKPAGRAPASSISAAR